MSPTICRRLFEEIGPGPLILHFRKILIFDKTHSLSKVIFQAMQLEKVLEHGTFQKTQFCTLMSNINLELNAVPVAAG